MQLALDKPKKQQKEVAKQWDEAEPFVINTRALLVHRPRFVREYHLHIKHPGVWKGPHIAVEFYCGQTVANGKGVLTFSDTLERDALICEQCERRAVMAGLPASSDIAGHHVHIGKLMAVRTCGH